MGTFTLTVFFIYWASAALNLITDGTEVHKYRLVKKASSEKVIFFTTIPKSSSLVECASFCSSYEGPLNTLPCNAFRTKHNSNETCRLLNVWNTNELLDPITFDGHELSLHVRDDIDITCTSLPTVVDSTVYDKSDCGLDSNCQSADYSAKWVLDGDKSCKTLDKNVWFGQKDQSGQYIIFDLGCRKKFRKITLQNHFNIQSGMFSNIWGVQKFKIEVSNSNVDFNKGTWSIIMEETLDDDSSKQDQCAVPIIGFQLPEFYQTRFLRFYVLKHFGDGAALQYFKID